MLANPHGRVHRGAGVRREVRRPEEARGDRGHRALDARFSYRPNVGMTLVRQPELLRGRLPYIDRVEIVRGRGQCLADGRLHRAASTTSAGRIPGRSIAPTGCRSRTPLKQKRAQSADGRVPGNVVMSHIFMRTDKAPFSDVRVRQAMSMAIDRAGIVNATLEGVGVDEPPGTRGPQGVVGPPRSAGRGRALLPIRSGRGEEAPRRSRLSQGLPGDRGLFHLRLHHCWSIRCNW